MNIFRYLKQLWYGADATERAALIGSYVGSTEEAAFSTTEIDSASIERALLKAQQPASSISSIMSYISNQPLATPIRSSLNYMDMRIRRGPKQTLVKVSYKDSITQNIETTTLRIKKQPGFLPISNPTFNEAIHSHVFDYLDPNDIFAFLATSHESYRTITRDYFDPNLLPALFQFKRSEIARTILNDFNAYLINQEFFKKIAPHSPLFYLLLGNAAMFFGLLGMGIQGIVMNNKAAAARSDARSQWQALYKELDVQCTDPFKFPILDWQCIWGVPLYASDCDQNNLFEIYDSCDALFDYFGINFDECNLQHTTCSHAQDLENTGDHLIFYGVSFAPVFITWAVFLPALLYLMVKYVGVQRLMHEFSDYFSKKGLSSKVFVETLVDVENITIFNNGRVVKKLKAQIKELEENGLHIMHQDPALNTNGAFIREVLSTYSGQFFKKTTLPINAPAATAELRLRVS